ncbi:MBL fold metallo-hydrolase [Roseibium sp. RKSG952]|uniref:MBL fold metallo-hydrolase n=1 Tax=Roseibium sp. RKSG952 TaxID=2529384 RepID=UPI0012BD1EC4|nr:MBL fold metallo-hydrolase [Roseibium sp. RKSG952]MTI00607.1 metal-dependent hydrolase [Roseibium sp. RKSG952]
MVALRVAKTIRLRDIFWAAAGFLFAVLLSSQAFAVCQLVAGDPFAPRVIKAALAPNEVQIRYIGHSTFEIETPKGVRIATDYNDSVKPRVPPTVATMNGAHSTHYTLNPEPEIEHVLMGWNLAGGPIDHDVIIDDVRIRNIQTNIRGWDGETRRLGNSIFVFEIADLCIAHLGHLHHRLTEEDLLRLGQIDIVFAAVDNSSTLRLESLMQVLEDIGPSLVIPMHFHFFGSLEAFTSRASIAGYQIELATDPLLISRRDRLPTAKTVYVMQPTGG